MSLSSPYPVETEHAHIIVADTSILDVTIAQPVLDVSG